MSATTTYLVWALLLAAPPASLLAFAAWRHGDGVLANLALDRALDANPGYPMAHLLAGLFRRGTAPTELDWPGLSGGHATRPDRPTDPHQS